MSLFYSWSCGLNDTLERQASFAVLYGGNCSFFCTQSTVGSGVAPGDKHHMAVFPSTSCNPWDWPVPWAFSHSSAHENWVSVFPYPVPIVVLADDFSLNVDDPSPIIDASQLTGPPASFQWPACHTRQPSRWMATSRWTMPLPRNSDSLKS